MDSVPLLARGDICAPASEYCIPVQTGIERSTFRTWSVTALARGERRQVPQNVRYGPKLDGAGSA